MKQEHICVAAVIVTFNRKELLRECLNAVLAQKYAVSKIILIDNASTDGTKDMLAQNGFLTNEVLEYHKMTENLGGAGGFFEAIKIASQGSYDFVWIMDDDTIPQSDCLWELIHAIYLLNTHKEKFSFVASAVFGENHEYMNLPVLNNKLSENGYAYWYHYLADGLVNIKAATFVSILVNTNAIKQCGLPCKDYFIWGDDYEYTTRLTAFYGDGYFVGKSVAIHKRKNAQALSIHNVTDKNRLSMYHYLYRNTSINARYYDPHFHLIRYYFKSYVQNFPVIFTKNGFVKLKVIYQGLNESIRDYPKFKKYIDCQLHQK